MVVVAETGGFCEAVAVVVALVEVVVAGFVEVCDCTGSLAETVVVTFAVVDVDAAEDEDVFDDVDVVEADDAVVFDDDETVVEVFSAADDEASVEVVVAEVTTGLLSAVLSVAVLPQEADEHMIAAEHDNAAAVFKIIFFLLRIKPVSILCLLFMIESVWSYTHILSQQVHKVK